MSKKVNNTHCTECNKAFRDKDYGPTEVIGSSVIQWWECRCGCEGNFTYELSESIAHKNPKRKI